MPQEFTFALRTPTDWPPRGPSMPARPASGRNPQEVTPSVKPDVQHRVQPKVQVIPVRRPMQTRRAWASDEFLRRERELDELVCGALTGLSRMALPPSDAARLQDAIKGAVNRWRKEQAERR